MHKETPCPSTQHDKAEAFRALHHRRVFRHPQPLGRRQCAGAGRPGLRRAGHFQRCGGRRARPARWRDHARRGAGPCPRHRPATELPVAADLENGFGDAPADAALTIRLAGEGGLVGGSIEDASGVADRRLYGFDAGGGTHRRCGARRRVRLPFPFTLTARCENFLRGNPDLDDTIARLQAYEKAGADVLFAPALPDLAAVRAVCAAVGKPVNFMVGMKGTFVQRGRAAGGRRAPHQPGDLAVPRGHGRPAAGRGRGQASRAASATSNGCDDEAAGAVRPAPGVCRPGASRQRRLRRGHPGRRHRLPRLRPVGLGAGHAGAARARAIVAVSGNHEYYDRVLQHETAAMHAAARALQSPPLHLLDCGQVVIDGVRFLGCTLWTDFALRIDTPEGPRSDPRARHRRGRPRHGRLPHHRLARRGGGARRDRAAQAHALRHAAPASHAARLARQPRWPNPSMAAPSWSRTTARTAVRWRRDLRPTGCRRPI